MDIVVQNLGKRYNYEWIFKEVNYTFRGGNSYAITGHNGSGKSTFLQILAGIIPESRGVHHYVENNEPPITADDYYTYISFASPYLDLFEELTLAEHLRFHFKLKEPIEGLSLKQLAGRMYLDDAWSKQIKNFSSGMKQRLKLGLGLFADVPVTFLDEPTSNMDQQGKEWYLEQVGLVRDRLLLIASNNPEEYTFCDQYLNIPDFK